MAAEHRAGLHDTVEAGAGRPRASAAGEQRGAAAVRDHGGRPRTATMRALQEYTRLKARDAEPKPADLAWRLVLDAMIFQAEAEVRWLDHCEVSLVRHNRTPLPQVVAASAAPEYSEVRS
ncbi:hypothetical protein [Micromonospora viridifaciens]|uniref:hypothetical protein n=1 Tax=Micromonospora viridifaciens TaxID=1881 RepID=UPI0038B2B136